MYAVKEHHLDKTKKYTDKVLSSKNKRERERERNNIRERAKKAPHRRQGISKHVLHCSRHSKEGIYWHLSRHLDSEEEGKMMAPTKRIRKNFSILFCAKKK